MPAGSKTSTTTIAVLSSTLPTLAFLENAAAFSRNAKVGKVDDNTAIVVVDVFDPAGMMAMFNSDEAKKMAEEMGVVRTPFKLQAMG